MQNKGRTTSEAAQSPFACQITEDPTEVAYMLEIKYMAKHSAICTRCCCRRHRCARNCCGGHVLYSLSCSFRYNTPASPYSEHIIDVFWNCDNSKRTGAIYHAGYGQE